MMMRGFVKIPDLILDGQRQFSRRASFRGDAKHRTRNLEIPRCAIAHLRSGASAPSPNDALQLNYRWLFEIKSGIFTNAKHHDLFGRSGISHCLENALW